MALIIKSNHPETLPRSADLCLEARFGLNQTEPLSGIKWKDYFNYCQSILPYTFIAIVRTDDRSYAFEAFYLRAFLEGKVQAALPFTLSGIKKVYLLAAHCFEIDLDAEFLMHPNQGYVGADIALAVQATSDPLDIGDFYTVAELEFRPIPPDTAFPELSIEEAKDVAWFEGNNPWWQSYPFLNVEKEPRTELQEQFKRAMEESRKMSWMPQVYENALEDSPVGVWHPSLADKACLIGKSMNPDTDEESFGESALIQSIRWLYSASIWPHNGQANFRRANCSSF